MILERLRNGVRKLAADAGMGKEYKDVFELEGVPSFREFYDVST